VQQEQGFVFVEDDHGVDVLPETWAIAEQALARAPNLRAVVVECERNPIAAVRPVLERTAALWAARAEVP
jgi:uncharacterized protein